MRLVRGIPDAAPWSSEWVAHLRGRRDYGDKRRGYRYVSVRRVCTYCPRGQPGSPRPGSINCHDEDRPSTLRLFTDPWPGCGHRLLASPFRNFSHEHAWAPPHLCLALFFVFYFFFLFLFFLLLLRFSFSLCVCTYLPLLLRRALFLSLPHFTYLRILFHVVMWFFLGPLLYFLATPTSCHPVTRAPSVSLVRIIDNSSTLNPSFTLALSQYFSQFLKSRKSRTRRGGERRSREITSGP